MVELGLENGVTFKGTPCFIKNLFLRFVLINVSTNDPIELIPMVIRAGEEFDRGNATLDEDYEKTVNHVEFLVD